MKNRSSFLEQALTANTYNAFSHKVTAELLRMVFGKKRRKSVGEKTQGVEVAGGARRSERMPSHHLAPPNGRRRVAARWQMGLEKYGKDNYKKSMLTREDAYTFSCEAYNHLIEHAMKMANGLEPNEDHLGAIGWAVDYLAEVEAKFGCRWIDLLRTPLVKAPTKAERANLHSRLHEVAVFQDGSIVVPGVGRIMTKDNAKLKKHFRKKIAEALKDAVTVKRLRAGLGSKELAKRARAVLKSKPRLTTSSLIGPAPRPKRRKK